MKILLFSVLTLAANFTLTAQKFMTQSGTIKFFSKTPMENIDAVNNQVSSVFNLENGEVVFSVLMKGFVFEKALMQEHFNEKYVESDKFPKSNFKGSVKNFASVKLTDKPTEVMIAGKMTIHGVTKDIETKGTLTKVNDKSIKAASVFSVLLADYDIKVPAAVKENISESIEITVNLMYEKLDK